MSIAVFNSFSKGADDVATGTYDWVYTYVANTQAEDYGYGVATRSIANITQPNVRKYKLLSIAAGHQGFENNASSGYPYFVNAFIAIETDVLERHPTIKIEGANNTVTTITTSPSDWTYVSFGGLFSYWKYEFSYSNDATGNPDDGFRDIFASFTGETWTQWKSSGGPTSTARALDDDHPSSASAGSFESGITYTITYTGNTDFTAVGAADSNPGTIFTATGAGTGTGFARVFGSAITVTLSDP